MGHSSCCRTIYPAAQWWHLEASSTSGSCHTEPTFDLELSFWKKTQVRLWNIKGIVQLKVKILEKKKKIPHPHIFPKPRLFSSKEHKRRNFEKCGLQWMLTGAFKKAHTTPNYRLWNECMCLDYYILCMRIFNKSVDPVHKTVLNDSFTNHFISSDHLKNKPSRAMLDDTIFNV